jgi:hypothetical protein
MLQAECYDVLFINLGQIKSNVSANCSVTKETMGRAQNEILAIEML